MVMVVHGLVVQLHSGASIAGARIGCVLEERAEIRFGAPIAAAAAARIRWPL